MYKFGKMLVLIAGSVCGLLFFVFSIPLVSHLIGTVPGQTPAVGEKWGFSALGLAACVYGYLTLGRLERKQDARTITDARRASHLEAGGKPVTLGLLLLATAGLLAGGVAVAVKDGSAWMAGGCILLGLLLVYATWEAIRQLLRPGPMLSMDLRGIDFAMYGRIPWSEIVGLSLRQVHVRYSTISTLMVCVRSPHRYLSQAPPLLRWRRRAWLRDKPAFGTLVIPLALVNKKAEVIHETALVLRAKVSPPMLLHWYPSMQSRQIQTYLSMQAITDELEALPPNAAPGTLASIEARMQTLQPAIDSARQQDLARLKTDKRNGYLSTALFAVLFVIWFAVKLLR